MSLEKICNKIAIIIIPNELKSGKSIFEVSYGLCAFLTSIFTIATTLIFALIIGSFFELVLFLCCFIPLRISFSGFHCKKFYICVIITNIDFLLISYCIKKIQYKYIPIYILLILFFATYEISKEKNKKILFFYLVLLLINHNVFFNNIIFFSSIILNFVLVLGGEVNEKKN